MSNKVRIRKILKKQKIILLKDKEINSPQFYIKGDGLNGKEFVYHPPWKNENEKSLGMNMFRRFCEEVNAREVVIVSDTFIHLEENDNQKSEALLVSLEKQDKMEFVVLPYTRDVRGKISFGNELWNNKTEKDYLGSLEGLVK